MSDAPEVTADNLTDEQIRVLRTALRFEIEQARDLIIATAVAIDGDVEDVPAARARCADAINARAKADVVSVGHPAFVDSGTLIEHPAHDGVTWVFAACPLCARAKAVR